MTGKEIATKILDQTDAADESHEADTVFICRICAETIIDTALAVERVAMLERCLKVVWHSRGKCVSDASWEALGEEMRALGVT
jgi:hypothetical protein